MDVLVRAYWKPVYAHVRRRWNRSPEQAQDLTQGFFARAFEKQFFATYDPGKALFRTFLKTCLDRFVMEQSRDEHRLKRGGSALRLHLDFDAAEGELQRLGMPADTEVDRCFDDAWMRHLLSSAVERLRVQCEAKDKKVWFDLFERYSLDEGSKPTYAELAASFGISAAQVTNHLAAARREFRAIVLDELRELTSTEEEFRSEARALLGVEP